MKNKIFSYLRKPISGAPLISFKLIFGALMVFSTVRFIYLGWIEEHYVNPIFHFKYWGFHWVKTLPITALYIIHILMILGALAVMFCTKVFYRIGAITLFLTFTYTELIDLTYYLNHYYFVSLICLLLCIVPANQSILTKENKLYKVPNWSILIFKVQIAFVYVYAGIAKINYTWLFEALPLKIWLPAKDTLPIIGPIFSWEITPYLFSWIGMIYDCSVVFFLLYKPTRLWAYLTVVIFHLLTGVLFQIGVFPLVMIGATLLFFSDNWHLKFINLFKSKQKITVQINSITKTSNVIFYSLIIFFTFQVVFPWRFLLYDGKLNWTEQGYRFGWRVMLMEKAGTATFYVKDGITGREGIVVNKEFLNDHQEKQMAMQPDMILQFAHFLGEYYQKNGVANPQVRAEVYVTLNGKPSKLMIDPKVDLMKKRDTFAQKNWILPYD